MANFKEVVKDSKFKCDECNKVIAGKDLKLKKVKTNIAFRAFGGSFKYVDSKGNIMGGVEAPQKGDSIVCCPECKHEHPFGMDSI